MDILKRYPNPLRVIININMNSKLAGTTICKISFEGVLALKRDDVVSNMILCSSSGENNVVGNVIDLT